MYPSISILVPTYGRTKLLSEVVSCYINQDYPGDSELVIYNDLELQCLQIDQIVSKNKNIRIVNKTEREETLGHKRNALLDMATYDVVTFWDDDDIYLPHRLSLGISLLEKREAVNETKEWRLSETGQLTLKYARPFGTMTLLKSAIIEVGGFPNLERLQDVFLVNKLAKAQKLVNLPISTIIPSTIYRLSNVLIGGHVTDAPNKEIKNESGNVAVRDYVVGQAKNRIENGIEPIGNITIIPELKQDYLKLAHQTWDNLNMYIKGGS